MTFFLDDFPAVVVVLFHCRRISFGVMLHLTRKKKKMEAFFCLVYLSVWSSKTHGVVNMY
jgi:hypothetical protein